MEGVECFKVWTFWWYEAFKNAYPLSYITNITFQEFVRFEFLKGLECLECLEGLKCLQG